MTCKHLYIFAPRLPVAGYVRTLSLLFEHISAGVTSQICYTKIIFAYLVVFTVNGNAKQVALGST